MPDDARLTRVIRHLLEVADLLEALGENPHRIRAYRTGVAVLEANADDFETRLIRNDFERLPGIGRELAGKIALLAKGDDLPGLAELTDRIPASAHELMRVNGVDRKLAIYLSACLHTHTVAQLRQLAETHLLRTIPWLSAERERGIRRALAELGASRP